MLKSCFHGDISPGLAEDIMIKQKLNSYLVRQSDRDPSRLVLTFHDGEAKHLIIPDFGTEEHSKRLIKDRLEDTSNEVEHFLASYGCQFPVIPDLLFSPVPQWKKRRVEDTGGSERCAICPAVGDKNKMVKHLAYHQVKFCSTCHKYMKSSTYRNHLKLCSSISPELHRCDKCDFSTPHKRSLVRHDKKVHSKPFACGLEECDMKFGSKEKMDKHTKRHEDMENKKKKKKNKDGDTEKGKKMEQCKNCGETFSSKSSKYRHMDKVHVNPVIKSSVGIFKLSNVMSLSQIYKGRGRTVHNCVHCSYKSTHKGHYQNHVRTHLKKKRPDFYTCVSTCKRKKGDVYSSRHLSRVREHMKTCRWYKLTKPSVPKGMITKETVCLLASKVDISNNKMQAIVKGFADSVGRDLVDYNIGQELSKNLNSWLSFYYSMKLVFTNIKKQDKLVSTVAVFDMDNPEKETDAGLSAGGRRQIFLVAAAANVPETRKVVNFFHNEMRIWEIRITLILVGDNKMTNIFFG